MLRTMGVTAIRQGGSFADAAYRLRNMHSFGRISTLTESVVNFEISVAVILCWSSYYFWKNWRGPKHSRPSFGAFWGYSYESSWGPFEVSSAHPFAIFH